MKKLFTLLLSILLFASIKGQTPTLEELTDQVNLDSLITFVMELSGEVSVVVNGQTQTIVSRHKNQPGNNIAADYIKAKLMSYGLETEDQNWSSSGRNVIATQTGTDFPDQYYIICAHYDDMPSSPPAPGADDNASGTAAVIEAARIFSNYQFPFTIKYCLWDEEEQGLVGSDYYAGWAAGQNHQIEGVLNMDMIAYDGDGDNECDVHTKNVADSYRLSDKMVEMNSILQLGFITDINDPGSNYSDHKSFWDENYSAILLIEDFDDFHPYYHTSNDLIQYFDNDYFHRMAKLCIGTLAAFTLNLDIKIEHTPFASVNYSGNMELTAEIISGLEIGSGIAAPRLYYRVSQGSGFTNFMEVTGNNGAGTTWNFTIPAQPLGTIVQYYIAAQDAENNIVTTVPKGGSGFNPPGNTPPETFYEFYVAEITVALEDEFSDMNNWTNDGGWDITTSSYVSSPSSVTDSPSGEYPSNANSLLTTTDMITFPTGVFAAELEFMTKWEIETDWDYGQVLISTNGSTWTPLEGKYTNPGTGSFQPNGEPLYDGAQGDWVQEKINLLDYVGQSFQLRFMLKSDGYLEEDGWYIDDLKLVTYTTEPTQQGQANVTISEGWNLLSVPLTLPDMSLSSVFPNASSQAFWFNQTYQMTTDLQNDLGYWIKFGGSEVVQLTGDKLDNMMNVNSGWNMIGSIDSVISVTDITSSPAGIITSEFFAYGAGYSIADEIIPGKGYWVKTSGAGQIILGEETAEKVNDPLKDMISLHIRDMVGNQSRLYLYASENTSDFEMPPAPPENVFDARFSTGNYAENVTSNPEIVISAAMMPVKISSGKEEISLLDAATGNIYQLNEENNYQTLISGSGQIRLSVTVTGMPENFGLEQNYPNPFNPSTTIAYSLAANEHVTLFIYDVLGQKVATLVDDIQDQGVYKINFDASKLSSGIYFYCLKAGNFLETKKMILAK